MMKPSEESQKGQVDSPLVYGLGTAYSAVFVVLGEYLCLLFVLLLGDWLASSAILLFASAVSLLFFLAYVRLETSAVAGK